jgi:O-succinylbenzoate synthase
MLQSEGLFGWSECVAPGTPHYTYETVDTAWHVLTDFVLPGVVGLDVSKPASLLRGACAGIRGHPMAKATLEMAAWDLAAKGRGTPLAALLGGTRDSVDVGVTVGMASDEEELGDRVEEQLRDGYGRVKIKISPGRDVVPLRALRARFPDLELWADANCAYDVDDTAPLEALDDLDLGLVEEPISPGGLSAYARLQARLRTPICLDESITSAPEAATAIALGSCRVVNLKPGRVGGLSTSLQISEVLSEAGVAVWCGGMLETGIGRAHNVALASTPRFTLPGDISASRRYWERDIVSPELDVTNGHMAVPTGPGIGVDVDVERIEALTTRIAEVPPTRGPA